MHKDPRFSGLFLNLDRGSATPPSLWQKIVGGVVMVGVFALALMPLTLIVALVMGYYYTALKLTERLIDTLFLLILWRLLEAPLVRALAVAARRLGLRAGAACRLAVSRLRAVGRTNCNW